MVVMVVLLVVVQVVLPQLLLITSCYPQYCFFLTGSLTDFAFFLSFDIFLLSLTHHFPSPWTYLSFAEFSCDVLLIFVWLFV